MVAPATIRMTVEDWALLPEDVRGELVDGSLLEEELPSLVHECIVRWLLLLLAPYFEARGGQVFGSGVKLAIRANRGRMADVVCFGPGKRPEPRGAVSVPPDIVIEVVSPSPEDERRNRIEKPDDCGAFGVHSIGSSTPNYQASRSGNSMRAATPRASALRRPGSWRMCRDARGSWSTSTRCGRRLIVCWPAHDANATNHGIRGTW